MTDLAIPLPVRLARRRGVLPGFGLTMGFTLVYLSIVVLIPLAALVTRPWEIGWDSFLALVMRRDVFNALELSFRTALIATVINGVVGVLIAWVLVRYRFPGKRFVDAMVDLPFALPTAVAGIALTAIYAPNGWLGATLMDTFGLKVAYTQLGIIIALIFVGMPFVVRTIQPVLQDFDTELEEAAATLGAPRWRIALGIVLPAIAPAWLTGAALSFARAVGEYGSVIFIAGNMPNRTQIAPLVIAIQLDQRNYAAAAAVGVAMLALSFAILLVINLIQRFVGRR